MSSNQTQGKGNPLLQPTPQEPRRVTLEELKHKAEEVRNLAVTQTKEQVADIRENKMTTVALVGVGVVVAIASLAYFIGSGAGRNAAQREFDRIIHDPCGPFGPFGKDLDRG